MLEKCFAGCRTQDIIVQHSSKAGAGTEEKTGIVICANHAFMCEFRHNMRTYSL